MSAAEGLEGVAGGGPATSLVLYRQSVGEICPKKPYISVCDQDPDLRFPASCDAYGCRVCGARKARQKAALMTHAARKAERSRFITLTQLPTTETGSLDWQRARAQVRDLAKRLRADGYRTEWGWALERNPKETGFHAHAVQHGDYVPQRVLEDRWGGRRVDVRALPKPGAGSYTVKQAVKVAGYVLKNGSESFDGLSEHLAINGHRAAHFSRGFLHGQTSREALKEIAVLLSDGQERTWHQEPAWIVPRAVGALQ